MNALLRKARVVDDPGPLPNPLDHADNASSNPSQQRLVRPLGVRDKMAHRSMRALRAPGPHARRHRLDALAALREERARRNKTETGLADPHAPGPTQDAQRTP
jgi:hypothetical protein